MKVDMSRSSPLHPHAYSTASAIDVDRWHSYIQLGSSSFTLLLQRFRVKCVPVMYKCIKFGYFVTGTITCNYFVKVRNQFSGDTPHIITQTPRAH